MYKINILGISDKSRWNDYLKLIPSKAQDIYFTPEYYSLYQNYGDGEARCFVYEKDSNIAMYPYLMNAISPLGYALDKEYYDIQGAYGYNGLIASTEDVGFITEFWSLFDAWCKEDDNVAEFM